MTTENDRLSLLTVPSPSETSIVMHKSHGPRRAPRMRAGVLLDASYLSWGTQLPGDLSGRGNHSLKAVFNLTTAVSTSYQAYSLLATPGPPRAAEAARARAARFPGHGAAARACQHRTSPAATAEPPSAKNGISRAGLLAPFPYPEVAHN